MSAIYRYDICMEPLIKTLSMTRPKEAEQMILNLVLCTYYRDVEETESLEFSILNNGKIGCYRELSDDVIVFLIEGNAITRQRMERDNFYTLIADSDSRYLQAL